MLDRGRKPFRPGHYKSPKAPTDAKRPQHPERDRYDWITLYTAIVGVAVVCIGTGVSAYQAIVMRQELDSAVQQQRAWVRVDPVIVEDIRTSDEGFGVALRASITNSGAIPATGVAVTVEPRLVKLKDALAGRVGFKNICPDLHPIMGFTAFPGQTVNIGDSYRHFGQKEVEGLGSDYMVLFVRTCVVYRSGGSAEVRGTSGDYWVWEVEGGNERKAFAPGETLDRKKLYLHPMPLGHGAI